MNGLFSDDFLAAIERLKVEVRPMHSLAAGAHLSSAAGSSLDFRDFRAYSPGDDLRRMDWNVYRRTGHLFLRRFEHPTETHIEVLIDNSASMFVESPTRYAAAARIAAAIAAATLRGGDSLTVRTFGTNSEDMPHLVRARGRNRLPDILGMLSNQNQNDSTSFAAGIGKLQRAGMKRTVAFVISDFFDPEGIESLLQRLRDLTCRVVLVQIIQPWDANPELSGDAEFRDCETNSLVAIAASADVRREYLRAYSAFQTQLEEYAQSHASGHITIDASQSIVEQLDPVFPGGVLRVRGRAS